MQAFLLGEDTCSKKALFISISYNTLHRWWSKIKEAMNNTLSIQMNSRQSIPNIPFVLVFRLGLLDKSG